MPLWVWHVARAIAIAVALAFTVELVRGSDDALRIFWGAVIPMLPAVFLVAPGLWRNVCPLAASNQTPRYLKFTRALTLPRSFFQVAQPLGMGLFIVAVASREPLFNDSGVATGALLGGSLLAALVGGTLFKGKSGWCSSLCPLLPVQRVYGQTPFATVPNSHCRPCVGCTHNCYDFNPRVAFLADLYEDDRHWSGLRKLFTGALPGVVFAYFLLPEPSTIGTGEYYARFALVVGATAGSFFVLETLVRVTANTLTALFGAIAIVAFYYYAAPILVDTIAGSELDGVVWVLRAAVLGLALIWLDRTWAKERAFVAQTREASREITAPATAPVGLGGAGVLDKILAEREPAPEVRFDADGPRTLARRGASLLEVAESAGHAIEAGCRLGVCGADPVRVLEGMDNLSPVGADEKATLERLGLGPGTRMACCARVHGPVQVSLKPLRATDERAAVATAVTDFDASVRRVVVIGNGIAGVTCADHVRRNHPDCTIDVVAAEAHALYNRMGVSRLIYGRSAMTGLQLLPDDWYGSNRVDCWLNTRAVAIDRSDQTVRLGTGETLEYDRLVLAMGALPFVPAWPGWPRPGAFVLRSANDALAIRAYAQEGDVQEAVVAGGGLLGLEAAYAIHKLGLRVTVLELSRGLLRRQLDKRASGLLRSYLEGLGLVIELGAEIRALHGAQRLQYVELGGGRVLRADVLLASAGIVPDVSLATDAGLEVDRGVLVDATMRTSDPQIYAAGDIAQFDGRVVGLWPTAVEQAEIAAQNAVGVKCSYTFVPPVTMLKVAGVDLTSCGDIEGDDAVWDQDAESGRYRKLVLRDGIPVGAIVLGHPQLSPVVTGLVREARPLNAELEALRAGDWDVLV